MVNALHGTFTCTEVEDVVTVDDYGTIRRAHRDGMSIRQIARQFGHSRRIVRHALTHAEPRPELLTRNRLAPRLGPLYPVIDQILADDENAPRKQRHTAAQICRRLRDEHDYRGGYAQVQRYVPIAVRSIRKRSSLWAIFRANASKQISDTSTLTSPTAAGSCRFW